MKKIKGVLQNIGVFILTLSIPALLALDSIESRRYTQLKNEITSLEKKQTSLIENNKRLISDIGLLSCSARIEKIAIEKLGMHKAASDEIVRIEIGAK
ncbi:MAG TPA: cell division protein FtsL [Treponemataceae bacterium]|nr:cell division protein FtsL [Treponemataceae bacterium]